MAFVIPSIFTAIDKFSSPVKGMSRNIEAFALKAETTIARSERAFRKLTPALSETTKQFLSFASAAAVGGAILGATNYSVKKIMEYESEIANLSAVTGASGNDLEKFKLKITDVANTTHESSVNVAKAFTTVGNAQPELLKSADALASVTQSAIVLSQAAKMELAPAAEALTSILNQFGKGAKEAKETTDLLAAGSVIGSSEILDTANAIQKFGAVAANNGVKIVEAITAIETISDKIKGEEAGTQLKNFFAIMSAIKVQDPKAIKDLKHYGVNMGIVASKTAPLVDRLRELSKIKGDTGALTHVFGKENLVVATSLLSSTEKYSNLLQTITTSEDAKNAATKMAEKNNATLAVAIEQVKNAFVNLLTGSSTLSGGMKTLSNVLLFVRDNMGEIVKWVLRIISAFAIWKALMITSRAVLFSYNVVYGITNALQKKSLFFTEGNIIAKRADLITTNALTAAQWLYNAALTASPLMLVAAGVLVLAGAYAILNTTTESQQEKEQRLRAGVINTVGEETEAIKLLTQAYQEQGETQERALKLASIHQQQNLALDLAQQQYLLKTGTDVEKANAVENISAMLQRFVAIKQADGTMEEQKKIEAINPKQVSWDFSNKNPQNQSPVDANIKISVNDSKGNISVQSDNKQIKITTASTMPQYNLPTAN